MKQIPTTLKHLTYSIFALSDLNHIVNIFVQSPQNFHHVSKENFFFDIRNFFKDFLFGVHAQNFGLTFGLSSIRNNRHVWPPLTKIENQHWRAFVTKWSKQTEGRPDLKSAILYQSQNWFSESRKWRHANPWKCKQVSFHEGEMCKIP